MAATDYQPARLLSLARSVLSTEAQAIEALKDRLGDDFLRAVDLILRCPGRVVVSGIGKSGHIARKIASTLASTGTPAFFVHPAEALHGDLGMIARDDILLALSNSGETAELLAIVPVVKRRGARLIALTGNTNSSLARHADAHLDAAVDAEADAHGLAPTTSTTAALALGDALALSLLDARGFSAEDFAQSHPGGALGRRLLTHVRDVMRTGVDVPTVTAESTLASAVLEMTGKGLGLTTVVDADARIHGIFTDGDLRRCFGHVGDLNHALVGDYMSRTPRTIDADRLAVDAVEVMESGRPVMALLVVDAEKRLVGVLHMHDLIRAKVI
jgi:arabinose-5-phosphate isomerase